jgi:hypothetical protein
MLQLLIDTRHNIVTINLDNLIRDIPQRSMQHSPILCKVNLITPKHRIPQIFNLRLLRNINEQAQCLRSEEVLGEVEQDLAPVGCVVECEAELFEAGRVLFEFFF